MLGFSKKNCMYITRDLVVFAKVNTTTKKVSEELKYKYDGDLASVLAKIVDETKVKHVRITLADELSYMLKIEIDKKTKSSEIRELVGMNIVESIPEDLKDSEWDYKVFGMTKNTQKILAFAPVKEFYQQIVEELEKREITIDAVEPELISRLRNKNPLIGVAMKRDLAGEDKDVLNLHT